MGGNQPVKTDTGSTSVSLISISPYNHFPCLFTATYAFIGKFLLLKRDAARADTRKLLYFILTFLFSAPHCLDKAVAVFGKSLFYVVNGGASVGSVFNVFRSSVIESLTEFFEKL